MDQNDIMIVFDSIENVLIAMADKLDIRDSLFLEFEVLQIAIHSAKLNCNMQDAFSVYESVANQTDSNHQP